MWARSAWYADKPSHLQPLLALALPVADEAGGAADDAALGDGVPAQQLVPIPEQGPDEGDALHRKRPWHVSCWAQ